MPVVGFRCDARADTGVGHLVRCVALAEELVSRGLDVLFLGDVSELPFARRQLSDRDLSIAPAAPDPIGLAAQALDLGVSLAVLDGYHMDPRTGAAIQAAGMGVLAVVDGPFGADQDADLYLDQNLGAPKVQHDVSRARTLAGLDFVLLRDVVRQRRPCPPPHTPPLARSVLAFFGGTDPFSAAVAVIPLLLESGAAVQVSAVAATPEAARVLRGLTLAPGQDLQVLGPVDDLPALAAAADLVLSAAGSSTWELLCIGAPSALVCVTDNQEVGYRAVVAEGLAAPLGRLAELRHEGPARRQAAALLADLVGSPGERARLRAVGMSRVDGRGRERVADELLTLSGLV